MPIGAEPGLETDGYAADRGEVIAIDGGITPDLCRTTLFCRESDIKNHYERMYM